MELKEKMVGSIIFTLTKESYDGEVIEVVNIDEPFEFVTGTEAMLQSFEQNLMGLKNNDDFEFCISSKDAYGDYLSQMVVDFEEQFLLEQLGDQQDELRLDNFLPLIDPEGNEMNAKIIEINDGNVKLDFNHPLAGVDLYFKGKVLEIREATKEEIEDGRAFNPTKWESPEPGEDIGCRG